MSWSTYDKVWQSWLHGSRFFMLHCGRDKVQILTNMETAYIIVKTPVELQLDINRLPGGIIQNHNDNVGNAIKNACLLP